MPRHARLIASFGLLTLAWAPGSGTGCLSVAAGACSSDEDCGGGQMCSSGVCEDDGNDAVRIVSFSARPSTVPAGGSVTVAWETRNATSCSLSPAAGVVPRVGDFTTSIVETTTFELSCEGVAGPASSSATVSVLATDAGVVDGGPSADGGALDDDAGPLPADAGSDDGGPSDDDAGVHGGAPDAGPADAGVDLPPPLPRSCSDLRVGQGVSVDGLYLLDPDGADGDAPFEAWCDMTTDGGGWTLVLKVDGEKTTFRYENQIWTNENLLNESAPGLDTTEAKLPGYLSLPVDGVRVVLRDPSGTLRGLRIPLKGESLRDVVAADGDLTDEGTDAWLGLLDGADLQQSCVLEGVNAGGGLSGFASARVRLGAVGDDAQNCETPGTWIGVGGGTHPASCTTLLGSYTAGNMVGCSPGGVNDIPAFATVWVRDEDFTDLPSLSSCTAHLEAGRTVSGLYPSTTPAALSRSSATW